MNPFREVAALFIIALAPALIYAAIEIVALGMFVAGEKLFPSKSTLPVPKQPDLGPHRTPRCGACGRELETGGRE